MVLFIYCAGGFGREVIDLARRINHTSSRWNDIYFIDDILEQKEFYNTKVYAFDEVLEKFNLDTIEVSIANGEPRVRDALYNKLKLKKIKLASLIDNTAIISETAKIGEGVIVSPQCFISSLAILGNNTALNVNALIGHDSEIQENCVVSSAVNVAGHCSVGKNSYIGMGTQIKQGTSIGKDVIIGMGSVVHNDIPDEMIALGNPARPMRNNSDKKVFK